MDSRSVVILPPPLGGLVDDWTLQRRAVPGTRPDGGETCLFTSTDLSVHEPDLGVHEPDPGVHEPDPGVHDARSSCSRWTVIRSKPASTPIIHPIPHVLMPRG